MKLKELFGPNGENWTKRTGARDINGYSTTLDNPLAVSFCLVAGLTKYYLNNYIVWQSVRVYINKIKKNPYSLSISCWNDNEAEWKDIRELIETLDL